MMESNYRVSQDYDNVDFREVVEDATRIKQRFKVHVQILESSEGHYHLKIAELLTFREGEQLLDFSRCSRAYTAFCKRVGMFPIRIGKKIKVSPTRPTEVLREPRLMMSM